MIYSPMKTGIFTKNLTKEMGLKIEKKMFWTSSVCSLIHKEFMQKCISILAKSLNSVNPEFSSLIHKELAKLSEMALDYLPEFRQFDTNKNLLNSAGK